MVRLLLLRHAKSAWDAGDLADFDRPLNLRGRAAAPLMGRHMADHALLPDRVLLSAARRTRETYAGILPHLPSDCETRILRAIYEASEGDYLGLITREGGLARTLLLIGHNPAIQATATRIIGAGNPELSAAIAAKFPTAALAVIDLPVSGWKDVKPGSGRIVAFFRPREMEVVGAEDGGGDD